MSASKESAMPDQPTITCDMERDCTRPIAYIDVKGYIYCQKHGLQRKQAHRCRKLTTGELQAILNGEALVEY